jgi:hypothetical protein
VRGAGRGIAVVGGVAAVLLLSGCFGPSTESLISQSHEDFELVVDAASAVDLAVLHTLEVEEPVSELCAPDTDQEQTVFIAAGTIAITAQGPDQRELLDGLASTLDEERWTPVERSTLRSLQRAYLDPLGSTATITIEDGLLVIAVFSPCRAS